MATTRPTLDELAKKFPTLDRDVISDVFEAQGRDWNSALVTLCEMTAEAESTVVPSSITDRVVADRGACPEDAFQSHLCDVGISSPSRLLRRGGNAEHADETRCGVSATCDHLENPADDLDVAVFTEAFERLGAESDQEYAMALHKSNLNAGKQKNALQGFWRTKRVSGAGDLSGLSHAGELSVNRIAAKYGWADRKRIAALHSATGECEALTEELLLEESPEIRIIACNARTDSNVAPRKTVELHRHTGAPSSSTASSIAEALRAKDISELAAIGRQREGTSGMAIAEMKSRLATLVSQRDSNQGLYAKTMKNRYAQESKRLDADVRETWRELLSAICDSPGFRAGDVDLHGLTVEQALEVVEVKLSQRPAGRLRFITGRGNNSSGGKSVLRPRLENYFARLGVPCTIDETGGALIVRLQT
jgi:Smr domain